MPSETKAPTEKHYNYTFSLGTDTRYELEGRDVQAMKNFYAAVFPSWDFIPWCGRNWYFKNDAENFDGYMRDCSVWKPENYSNVMPREIEQFGKATRHLQSVDSIDEFKQRVEQHGGQAMSDREMDKGGCMYMVFKDPDWTMFSVYEKSWKHWTDEELAEMDRKVEAVMSRKGDGATSEAVEQAA